MFNIPGFKPLRGFPNILDRVNWDDDDNQIRHEGGGNYYEAPEEDIHRAHRQAYRDAAIEKDEQNRQGDDASNSRGVFYTKDMPDTPIHVASITCIQTFLLGPFKDTTLYCQSRAFNWSREDSVELAINSLAAIDNAARDYLGVAADGDNSYVSRTTKMNGIKSASPIFGFADIGQDTRYSSYIINPHNILYVDSITFMGHEYLNIHFAQSRDGILTGISNAAAIENIDTAVKERAIAINGKLSPEMKLNKGILGFAQFEAGELRDSHWVNPTKIGRIERYGDDGVHIMFITGDAISSYRNGDSICKKIEAATEQQAAINKGKNKTQLGG